MWLYLSQGLLLGGTAAAQPGPFQAYLLSQTLQHGWRRTLLAAFAPLISDGPIILLLILVLTRTPDWMLTGLRLVGGLFLLYLAYRAFCTFRTADSQPTTAVPPTTNIPVSQQNIFEAALMNALSPGPYIFWGTIGVPILLAGWRESATHGLSFLVGFYGMMVGGLVAFITLFALAKRLDPGVNRWLSGVSAVALAAFGLYQLWQGGVAVLN
jgi:threonine/homoserine/homoserine lactone efflux protein